MSENIRLGCGPVWWVLLCSAVLLFAAFPLSRVEASETWQVGSPDGRILITVAQTRLSDPYPDEHERLYYNVQLDRVEVIEWSPLGVTMEGAEGDFVDDLQFGTSTTRTIDESYTLPSGKTSNYRNHANELVLQFKNANGRQMEVVFRAYDDGMAYRYRFPGSGERFILGEKSGFRIPLRSEGWAAWWHWCYEVFYEHGEVGKNFLKGQDPSYQYTDWENTYRVMTDDIGFPALFQTPKGQWLLLTEAAVYGDYSGGRLTGDHRDKGLFQIGLADERVTGTLPWETPWRAAVIGESLATIVENTLPENLNPPSEIEDMSWITPGIVTWIWWYGPNGVGQVINIDPRAYARYRREASEDFHDFAREMGWADFPTTGFDVREARQWTPEQYERWVEEATQRGAKVAKIDFFNSDKQETMKLYDYYARLCLKNKLMVNFHGATIPRGQRRRWPNLVGWEAVRGAEFYKFPDPPTSIHRCTLPFTRNAIGPMDFTPETFYGPASPPRRSSSDAHQLALGVLYETGIQYWGDAPETYRAIPAALDYLKKVPARWDETRFIDGFPGEYACLARRNEDRWFLAGISSLPANEVKVPLAFLNPGVPYTLELHRDGKTRDTIVSETRVVSRDTVLELQLVHEGGFAGVMYPAASSKD